MSNLADLLAQKEQLEQQIDLARREQRDEAISRVRAILDESGLLLSDLASALEPRYSGALNATHKGYAQTVYKAASNGKASPRIPVAAKYKDPVSGQTWSGRGLRPRWLAAAIASGKTLEDFALKS